MTDRPERLRRLLTPRSVVFVGGGGLATAIDYCRANGFAGEARAINPRRQEIAGLPCVPSVADLDIVPDLAFLAVPKEAVVETAAALSALGIGAAVCNSSGFSESENGADRQAALINAAGDMPIMGPNCPGFANFFDGSVFMMDHFGDHAPRRGVAVISNGGAYLSDIGCADRSLPIGYMIGMGNQAMVTMAEMMNAVLEDPRVTAINLYFEGIADVVALSRAASKAARRGIPVVAVKGGRSEAGTRAARSHTASLSGTAEVASALFRRFGWVEAATPSEALETLKMLTLTSPPKGARTGFVTSSGSYAVLGGDAAEREGLVMKPPSEAAARRLREALPDYVGPANPLDISDAHGWPMDKVTPIYDAFLSDPHDIALQVMCYPPEGGWDSATWDRTVAALAGARAGRTAAFVNTLPENLPKQARVRMIENGVVPLQGLADGMRAVGNTVRYAAARDGLDPDTMPLPEPAREAARRITMDEAAAKALLADAGAAVPRGTRIAAKDPVPAGLTYPVALKALVDGMLHKSDAGAVALNLASREDTSAALDAMRKRLVSAGHAPVGYLIEEMVANPVGEIMIGIRQVSDIGLTLTLSLGGVAVELLEDSATVILPARPSEIEAALRGLRLFPMLDGYRGRPAADIGAALDAISEVIAFAMGNPSLIELEINPLMLTRDSAWIADAVLIVSEENPR